MIIKRELKSYRWEFDEDTKEIRIYVYIQDKGYAEGFVLDKVRWFSLFRFMIRASQRMSVKRRKQQGLFSKKKK